MSVFGFFVNLNHPSKRDNWIETTAVFTGNVERAAVGKPGPYKPADYNEYEIRYSTEDENRTGWYIFHPAPDPEAEDIKGTSIKIRYNSKKPWQFEAVPEG